MRTRDIFAYMQEHSTLAAAEMTYYFIAALTFIYGKKLIQSMLCSEITCDDGGNQPACVIMPFVIIRAMKTEI